MSIAGMAKEVLTFSVAAWLFGDELTLLNFVGLAITVGGKFSDNQACSSTATGNTSSIIHRYRALHVSQV